MYKRMGVETVEWELKMVGLEGKEWGAWVREVYKRQ